MAENCIFETITKCVEPTNCAQSWVIGVFLEPIVKRFEFNFNAKSSKLNALHKPQYFMDFMLQSIESNVPFMKQLLEPLILENGLDLNVEMVAICGLIDCIRSKLKQMIKILVDSLNECLAIKRSFSAKTEFYQSTLKGMKAVKEIMFDSNANANANENENDSNMDRIRSLIRHLIQTTIGFQAKLKKFANWTNDNERANVMNEVLEVELVREKWLKMEKDAINEESQLIAADWSDEQIFALVHTQFAATSNDFYLTNGVNDILSILEKIKQRIEIIMNLQARQQFVVELINQSLDLCLSLIEEAFPKHIHYRMEMSATEVITCCGIINFTDYLTQFLSQWNECKTFRALSSGYFDFYIEQNREL